MTETVDLSGAEQPATYSDKTLYYADVGIKRGFVQRGPGELSAVCLSLTSNNRWRPHAVEQGGKIIGVTCDCPNGTKGALRARCWHAAALEQLIAKDGEAEDE